MEGFNQIGWDQFKVPMKWKAECRLLPHFYTLPVKWADRCQGPPSSEHRQTQD